MGRFNTSENKGRNPGPRSAIKSKTVGREAVRVRTALGAQGYAREAQSELFLLAASFMGGDDVLHERSTARYRRLLELCATPEVYRDEVWAYNLINYLRNDAQMRTVSIVIACEIVRSRLAAQLYGGVQGFGHHEYSPRNRQLINVACARADEPCEVLAYWTSKYGQSKFDNSMIPQPILNGAGDAAVRLWNEFSVLKYGGGEGKKAVSFKDLLRLARPTPRDANQAALFGWITGTTPMSNVEISMGDGPLPMIAARAKMNSIPRDERISYLIGDSNAAR